MRLKDIFDREPVVGNLVVVSDPINKQLQHVGYVNYTSYSNATRESVAGVVLYWWVDNVKTKYRYLTLTNARSFLIVNKFVLPEELQEKYESLLESKKYLRDKESDKEIQEYDG